MSTSIRALGVAVRKHVEGELGNLLFDPARGPQDPNGLGFALQALRDAVVPPPENLLPLLPVCDGSFACVVCDRAVHDSSFGDGEAFEVVRWHLGRISSERQGEILDVDPILYLDSVASEIRGREPARRSVDRAAQDYYSQYVLQEARPRSDALRPVQLACQNVIIGLAALRHDAVFDGLRVEAYATCEVPHLATGEADRAMVALLLCDAFQSGGTMEVRFGRAERIDVGRNEGRTRRGGELPVPPALRRFARARGLGLGADDRSSISPSEARDLFLLVTPMSEELRFHAFCAFDAGHIGPERLCYALMAGIWRDIELAFLLGTSGRAASILEGGSDPTDRMARSAEAESCRAALMIGIFLARLESDSESPNSDAVEVGEDRRRPVSWAVQSGLGAVTFSMRPSSSVPWIDNVGAAYKEGLGKAVMVLPRPMPHRSDAELVAKLQAEEPEAAAFLLVPQDADTSGFSGVSLLKCPLTLDLLDQDVLEKLNTMRISRR